MYKFPLIHIAFLDGLSFSIIFKNQHLIISLAGSLNCNLSLDLTMSSNLQMFCEIKYKCEYINSLILLCHMYITSRLQAQAHSMNILIVKMEKGKEGKKLYLTKQRDAHFQLPLWSISVIYPSKAKFKVVWRCQVGYMNIFHVLIFFSLKLQQ